MKFIDHINLSEGAEAAAISDIPAAGEKYNNAYRSWRSSEGNPFVFGGKKKAKLHTYVDGMGVQSDSPERKEKSALKSFCMLATAIIFAYALAENVLILPVVHIMKLIGVDIDFSFHENTAYGNQYAVLAVFVAEGLLKLLVPLIAARRILKMPIRAAYPVRVGSKAAIFPAVSHMCLTFFAASIIRLLLPTGIFTVNDVGMTYLLSENMDNTCKAVFLSFELVALPLLLEFLFHGALFHAARQFGNVFSIVFTALLAVIVMHNPTSAPVIFLRFVISGVAIIKSGSFFVGIGVNIISRIFSYLLYFYMDFQPTGSIRFEYLHLYAVLVIGLLAGVASLATQKHIKRLSDHETFLSLGRKFRISFLESSFVAVWILYFILVGIEILV